MERWNWIEDAILPVAAATLMAAWLGVPVLWATRAALPAQAAPVLSPVLLAALLLAAVASTRVALTCTPSLAAARVLVLGSGLAGVLGAAWLTYRFSSAGDLIRRLVQWDDYVSPEFAGVAACGVAWWVGIVIGRSHLPQRELERAFYFGILGLGFAFSLNQAEPLIAPSEALAATLTFFAAGLAALALVSFENSRRYHASLTGTRLAVNRHWLVTVASVVGAILLLGVLTAALISPASFDRLAAAFRGLLGLVARALAVVAGAFAYAVSWLIYPIFLWLRRLVGDEPFELPQPPSAEEFAQGTSDALIGQPWMVAISQAAAVLIVLALAALAFWLAVRQRRRPSRRDSDEVRESIVTGELVWRQLRSLFRRRQPPTERPPFLPLPDGADDPRLIVRRAYQGLLHWGQARSLPRAAGQTPTAYAATLAASVAPGRRSAVEAIAALTVLYEHARYAAEPPSPEEAQLAQGAVNEIVR